MDELIAEELEEELLLEPPQAIRPALIIMTANTLIFMLSLTNIFLSSPYVVSLQSTDVLQGYVYIFTPNIFKR